MSEWGNTVASTCTSHAGGSAISPGSSLVETATESNAGSPASQTIRIRTRPPSKPSCTSPRVASAAERSLGASSSRLAAKVRARRPTTRAMSSPRGQQPSRSLKAHEVLVRVLCFPRDVSPPPRARRPRPSPGTTSPHATGRCAASKRSAWAPVPVSPPGQPGQPGSVVAYPGSRRRLDGCATLRVDAGNPPPESRGPRGDSDRSLRGGACALAPRVR